MVLNMYITKVNSQGQTTIPIELRRKHKIAEESEVTWVEEGNRLVLKPARKVDEPLKVLFANPIKSKKSALQLCQEIEKEFW